MLLPAGCLNAVPEVLVLPCIVPPGPLFPDPSWRRQRSRQACSRSGQLLAASGIWHLPVQVMCASVCVTKSQLDRQPASLNPYSCAHLQRVQPAGLDCRPWPRCQIC